MSDLGSTRQWSSGQLEHECFSLLKYPSCHSVPFWNLGSRLPDFSREDKTLDFQVKSHNVLMLVVNSNLPFMIK